MERHNYSAFEVANEATALVLKNSAKIKNIRVKNVVSKYMFLCVKEMNLNILSRDRVTIDGFLISNRNYLNFTNRDYK
jgi:hypothetical protein